MEGARGGVQHHADQIGREFDVNFIEIQKVRDGALPGGRGVLHGQGGRCLGQVEQVLDPALRAEALRALYRMNVTYATLFPDLDGLARSLGYELEAIWERLVEDYERGQSAHTRDDPTHT